MKRRRSEHSRDELIALAVSAARAIILEQGVAKVSARAIAGRMGYSPGTLYNLFEGVDEILYRVNIETLQGLGAAALTEQAAQTDPLERLVALGRAYVTYAEEHPQLWLAVFDFRPAAGTVTPVWFEEAVALLFGIITESLAPFFGKAEERLREASARVLWSGVHGISLLNVTGRLGQPEGMTAADMATLLIRTFVHGLEAERDPDAD